MLHQHRFSVRQEKSADIFMTFGHTGKHYQSNLDSLHVATRSYSQGRCDLKCSSTYMRDIKAKKRCLLQARNTVFWPQMTYEVQELIERCIICQEHGKSQPIIGTTQELLPFLWHTLATDIFYWKRMDFLIVADVFSKYFLVRKLANSTSAAICAELAIIVTELGLPYFIRSDNGPCYNSKKFQQFLQ